MPGGLFQLTAIAKEDIYLNVNPQLSYFRSVYSRYSNFAKITYNIDINNTNNDKTLFNTETISTIKIPDNGDLIKDLFVNVTLPKIYCDFDKYSDVKWSSDLPFKIIKSFKALNVIVTLRSIYFKACIGKGHVLNHTGIGIEISIESLKKPLL